VAQLSPLAHALAAAFWPGPLTLVLPAAANLDSRLVSGEGVGVRLGGPSDAARIAERYGRPLTATSANPPGQPATGLASVVSAAFAEAISRGQLLVIAGESPAGSASTVVTVSAGEARVLRLGAVSAEDIQRVARTSSSGPEQP
jgi:L-threonylcarbamoyladenylate synthase